MNKILEELKDEYTPKYCLQLEAAYGEGMMSEGGKDGIEHMFDQIPLKNKTALDIGSGLGGMAFYLADKYDMHITGIEVNPWMVAFSEKQIPEHLKSNVSFLQSHGNSDWPIPNSSYDIIYSKGVLTHLEKKDEIFQECYRLLKKDGFFVITDWLSSEDKRWGKNIERLVELENLILFPESENGYIELLKKNGFTLLSLRDDSLVYLKYNREIIEGLQNRIDKQIFLEYFNENELKAAIVGYQSIVKALEVEELQIFRFVARKT